MENNPYSSPAANLFGSVSETSAQGVSEPVLLQLKRTKPWVRLISVCCLILGILMLLVAVGIGTMGGLGKLPDSSSPSIMWLGTVMYALMGLLIYIYPGVKLWKFANRIATLLTRRSDEDLIAALDQQRSLWKYIGIWTLLMVCFVGLAILASIAVPIFNTIQSSAAGQ